MLQNFLFRKAGFDDIPAIVHLVNSAYRGESSRAGWTTEADFLDGIRIDADTVREMITNPQAAILQCFTNQGALSGCVYVEKQQNARLYLGMLTVNPLDQTKGIGKMLMREAETYAKANQCSSIIMTVITVRKELIEWYERRGYSKTEQVRPFPNNPKFGIPKRPLEFVLMEKELGT